MAVQTVKSLLNRKNKMDGLDLLNSIDTETVKVAFFDPQYRGILDKLSYGNEGCKPRQKLEALYHKWNLVL